MRKTWRLSLEASMWWTVIIIINIIIIINTIKQIIITIIR